MNDHSPPEDLYRSQFRLPYPLYERLKNAADAEKRSVNAEIVLRLEASFAGNDLAARLLPILDERDQRLLQALRETVAELTQGMRPS